MHHIFNLLFGEEAQWIAPIFFIIIILPVIIYNYKSNKEERSPGRILIIIWFIFIIGYIITNLIKRIS